MSIVLEVGSAFKNIMGVMYIKIKLGIFDKMFRTAVVWMMMIVVLHCAGLRVLLVRGCSMQPTICEGDLVVGWMVKDASNLRRGDMITFYPVHSTDVTYVKRIVAFPGEIVEAQDDILLVNGKDVGLSYTGTGTWGPVAVEDNCIFVLGDNRLHSVDSRILGPVPMEQIVARVVSG